MAPFTGFFVPSLLHSAALIVGTAAVVLLLYAIRPPVTQRIALSFVPWIITGAVLHVFYQLGERYHGRLYPDAIAPFFSAPAVYLTTFVLMGIVWVFAAMRAPSTAQSARIAKYLTAIGTGIMLPLAGLLVRQGLNPGIGPMEPILPVFGLILTLALTFVAYTVVGLWRTDVIARVRYVGAFVLFAHLFDGVTTTIGVDFLGAGERSVVPRLILEFAADLPTEPFLGTGWLFILVKLLVAVVVVVLFADYVSEKPSEGTLLLAFVGAVGLGPATNNFFLFLLGVV